MTIPAFRHKILSWYKKNRRDMPWRKTFDPYRILVSEIMLQQTQVARVLPKYQEFLKAFPALESLARSKKAKLLSVWQGLGYWRRALFLRETAKKLAKEYRGKFPKDPEVLETFPGIGPYTARALSCFAFGGREPFLDTNVRRVYIHFFFPERNNISDIEILKIADKAVWKKNPREWHYALFDYGAIVLRDKKINRKSRAFRRQSPFQGSFRSFRAKAVRFILLQPKHKISEETLDAFLAAELKNTPDKNRAAAYSPKQILDSLIKDKLIRKIKGHYAI